MMFTAVNMCQGFTAVNSAEGFRLQEVLAEGRRVVMKRVTLDELSVNRIGSTRHQLQLAPGPQSITALN